MQGVYINLDSSLERRRSLLSHLSDLDLASDNFIRFRALQPSDEEMKNLRGLRWPGEFGIWKSYLSLIAEISNGKHGKAPIVIEDDTRFSYQGSRKAQALQNAFENGSIAPEIDILFLDYFISPRLLKSIWHIPATNDENSLALTDGNWYLACLSSFIIRKSSCEKINILLSDFFFNSPRLYPIDIIIRNFIRSGQIKALLSVPPLSAPDWQESNKSTSQYIESEHHQNGVRALNLCRILLANVHSPTWCYNKLNDLYKIYDGEITNATKQDFIDSFAGISEQIPIF